jgi:PAS domain S-box-containing protein
MGMMDEHSDALSRDSLLHHQAQAEDAIRSEIASLRQAEQRYRLVADLTWDWEFWMAPDQTMAYVGPACERISGYPPHFFESCSRLLEIVMPEDRPGVEAVLARAMEGASGNDYELRIVCRDGSLRWVSLAYRPVPGPDGALLGVRGSIRDISQRKGMEASLEARLRQQAAVAHLSEMALGGAPLAHLLDEVAARAADTIGVEYSSIAELLPGGQELLVRAGAGWREGIVGVLRLEAGSGSQSGYTLQSDEPVVVQDLAHETRFRPGPQLLTHGVVSSLTVIIQGRGGAFGTLGVFSRERRVFSQDDVHYLQAVANVLGMAIARWQAEQARDRLMGEQKKLLTENEEQRAFLEQLFESMSEAVIVFDTGGRIVQANPAAMAAFDFETGNETAPEMVRRLSLRRTGGSPLQAEELPGLRALAGEGFARERMVLTNARGEERTVLASSAPLRGARRASACRLGRRWGCRAGC